MNDFGKAFKDGAFKFPKDDADLLKVAPTLLGAEAQKQVWPKSVWPGTIPYQRSGRQCERRLGRCLLNFVNIGRFLKLPTDALSLRAGQFELDLPVTQARNINLSPYDIFSESNIGAISSMVSLSQNVNNSFTFAGAAKGVEFSGGHTYGGYHYSVAILNQNTSGVNQTGSPYVPSDSSLKDVYARVSYRFNLERDAESRNSIRAAGATGPRDHTSLSFGTFYLRGKSQQGFLGATAGGNTVLYAREPYHRIGGDFNFNYRTFNLFGVYLYGRDNNLLPVDAGGLLIPLPLGSTAAVPAGLITSVTAKFNGGFVEADYMPLPWIMTIARYDRSALAPGNQQSSWSS